MLDSYLRSPYQKILVDPLAKQLTHLPTDTITLLGCLIGLLVWPLLALGQSYLALGTLLTSGYLDTLDGSLARLRDRASSVGTALDICCDRIVEMAIVLGLYFVAPAARALPCILMLGSILLCVTSFLVVGIFAQPTSKKGFRYSPGLIERTEAFLFFTAMILFPRLFGLLSLTFAALGFLTAWLRLFEFVRLPPDSPE